MGPLALFVASPRWAACESGCARDGLAHGCQEHGAETQGMRWDLRRLRSAAVGAGSD